MTTDTERETRSSSPRMWAPREPHLFVVLQGARPLAGGMRCSLRDADEVAVGRGERLDASRTGRRVTIRLQDSKVSAQHLTVSRKGGHWIATDFGSTNGTLVNGEPITDRSLAEGDILQIGGTLLRLRTSLPTPEQTPDIDFAEGAGEAGIGLGTLLPALRAEHATVVRLARARVPVLLLGDTGTGKEVIARAIHGLSERSGSFVPINCAALPKDLVESLLFGHVKGAFSGATRDEVGFIRSAHGGTLFLDEIGDLPLAAQAVLLRVLQEGEVVPVGSTRAGPVDLRVVAATHRPVEVLVAQGNFRRDLLARLQGFTHRLWPLADRREDIGLLVAALFSRIAPGHAGRARISPAAARALVRHDWPLNVRELAQALGSAWAQSDDGAIDLGHLPHTVTRPATGEGRQAQSAERAPLSAEQAELHTQLTARLEQTGGNVAEVARTMKKAPMQIYRWMRTLGIDPRAFR